MSFQALNTPRMCPQPADNFRTYVQHLPCSRIKHNRAKPMFELPSALFLIADGNEFRFARFYIVCEAVPLEALGNPLIVCGLPDTSVDCQSVAKTRNPMPGAMRKKCSDFAPKNRRRQVPAGTRYHLVITSCLCFSPPCSRDASGC